MKTNYIILVFVLCVLAPLSSVLADNDEDREDGDTCNFPDLTLSDKTAKPKFICCKKKWRAIGNLGWSFLTRLKCCGDDVYDEENDCCQNNEVFSKKRECAPGVKAIVGKEECCQGKRYTIGSHKCCNNVVIPLDGKNECCGNERINPETHACVRDRKCPRETIDDNECGDDGFISSKEEGCCLIKATGKKEKYSKNKHDCCNGEKIVLASKFRCCNGTSKYHIEEHSCVEERLCPKDSVEGTKCDGVFFKTSTHACCQLANKTSVIYHKETEDCCDNQKIKREFNKKCCGGKKHYDTTKFTCIEDKLCPKESVEKNKCNNEFIDADEGCCVLKNSTKVTHKKNTHICCDGQLLAASGTILCCGGKTFNSNSHKCIDNDLCPRDSVDGALCNGKYINTKTEICCAGDKYNKNSYICCLNVLKDRIKSNGKKYECCGAKEYSIDDQYCIDNEVVDKIAIGRKCGNSFYNCSTHFCCNSEIHPTETKVCCNNVAIDKNLTSDCCFDKIYNPSTHFCTKVSPQPFPSSDSGKCGGNPINTVFEGCCKVLQPDGTTIVETAYNLDNSTCCNNKFVPSNKKCCGNDIYDPKAKFCSNGDLYDLNLIEAAKCGTTVMNITIEACCNKQTKYTTATEYCCKNKVNPILNGTVHMACCGDTNPYVVEEQFCLNNADVVSKSSLTMCGDKPYNCAQSICCNNQIHPKESHFCCNNKVLVKRDNSSCCGNREYNPKTEKCILDDNTVVLIDTIQSIVCGGTLININTHDCCNNKSILKSEQFCCNNQAQSIITSGQKIGCCNNTLYSLSQKICVNDMLISLSSLSKCGAEYYNNSIEGCCNEKVFQKDTNDCCNNTLISVSTSACCAGRSYSLSNSVCYQNSVTPIDTTTGGTLLCGNVTYIFASQGCCDNGTDKLVYEKKDQYCCHGKVQFINVSNTMFDCCSNFDYSKDTHFCVDGKLVPKTAISQCGTSYYNCIIEGCCNQEKYNRSEKACCSNQLLTVRPDSDCCDSKIPFNPKVELCMNGQVKTIATFLSNGTCDGKPINMVTHDCCNVITPPSTTPVETPFTKNNQSCCDSRIINLNDTVNCCGNKEYNPSSQICFNGVAYPIETLKNIKCNQDLIDTNLQGCCLINNTYTKYEKKVSICCGNIFRNRTETEECCNGKTIYNSLTHYCINDIIIPKDSVAYAQCNTTYINLATEGCCLVDLTTFKTYTTENSTCCNHKIIAKNNTQDCCGTRTFNPLKQYCLGNSVVVPIDSVDAIQCGSVYIDLGFQSCCKVGNNYQVFNKNSQDCCNGAVMGLSGTQRCCDGKLVYDPTVDFCIGGGTTIPISSVESAKCGSSIIDLRKYGCCMDKSYLKDTQDCCNNAIYNRTNNLQCCVGYSSYNSATHVCCKDGVYNSSQRLCCGSKSYNLATQTCLNDQVISKDYVVVEKCNDVNFNCATQGCCNKTLIYDKETKVCCGAIVYPIDSRHKCCVDELYDSFFFTCCGNKIVTPIGTCCGTTSFDKSTHTCCNGQELLPVSDKTTACCGGRAKYNTTIQKCCEGSVVSYESLSSNEFGCCIDKSFYPKTELCCHGQIFKKAHAQSFCCDTMMYNRKSELCCSGKVIKRSRDINKCPKKMSNYDNDDDEDGDNDDNDYKKKRKHGNNKNNNNKSKKEKYNKNRGNDDDEYENERDYKKSNKYNNNNKQSSDNKYSKYNNYDQEEDDYENGDDDYKKK